MTAVAIVLSRSLLALIVGSFVFLAPLAATAETVRSQFYPLLTQGELTGCQVGFSVLRSDSEYSGGAPVVANGLLVFYGPRNERVGAALRIGVGKVADPINFEGPARAYLSDGLTTNIRDASAPFDSDQSGFRVFPFSLGKATLESIGTSITDAKLLVAYGMAGTTVDATFEVNLEPTVHRQWVACMQRVVS